MSQNRIRRSGTTEITDDGLFTEPVGGWAEEKYRFLGYYSTLFSTGMKAKWDKRVYIDLFAGCGRARVRKSNEIFLGSPLLALNVPDKYDSYIFCEEDHSKISALQERVLRLNVKADINFVCGNCNEKVNEIMRLIPKHSKATSVLSFCVVDPYNLGALQFETIKLMGQRFIDFIVLLALGMDANRNKIRYMTSGDDTVSMFLGLSGWREKWDRFSTKDSSFQRFLATTFVEQMIDLGYLKKALTSMREVRSDEKNLPLYHLAFFSKHELGYKFWREARKRIDEPELF